MDASALPISIVIVGIGPADFTKMNILDSDDKLLKSRSGKVAQSDIVQFVPFRDFANQHPSRLAAALYVSVHAISHIGRLAEIPDQFLSFMKRNNILPRPPPTQQQLADMVHMQLGPSQSVRQ